MVIVLALLLDALIVAYAGGVLKSTVLLVWHLRADSRKERRRMLPAESRAVVATIMTMVTLIALSLTTIVYVAFGHTPQYVLARLGMEASASFNTNMLLIGTGLQALLKLYAMDKLIQALRALHFSMRFAPQRREDVSPVTAATDEGGTA